jgi:hypothetical protein
VVSPFASFGGALTVRLAKHGSKLDTSSGGRGASVGLSALYLTNDALTPEDVRVHWTAGALTICPGWSIGSAVTLEPCARGIGGWLAASDHGVTNPRSAGRSSWSAGALVRAVAGIGAGFELELEAGVEVPIVPRRFVTTTPEETVAETPRVSGIASLGIARGL